MKSILNTFYSDFLVQPFSERTINIYSRVILDFIGGLRPTLTNVIDTTPADIQRYLSELLKDGKSNATYNQSLAALSAFFKFCYNCRIIDRNPTAMLKSLRNSKLSTTQTISQDGFKKMLKIIDESPDPVMRLRDKAILLIALLGALRRSEIANLTRAQLNVVEYRREKFLVINFKGRSKSRRPDEKIILDKRALMAINKYLEAILKMQQKESRKYAKI